MGNTSSSFRAFCVFWVLVLSSTSSAQSGYDQKHIEVCLRMIGHQVLLKASDSSSRVLPIEKIDGRYCIQFENDFGFNPDDLVEVINRVLKENATVNGYIVEVEKCATGQVVYSFEMGDLYKPNTIPCRGRDVPKDCYRLFLTLKGLLNADKKPIVPVVSSSPSTFFLLPSGALLVLVITSLLFWRKRKMSATSKNPHAIAIGAFQFDPRKATLSLAHLEIELSSKEADLLMVLHAASNTTVAREIILNRVWGDEGDYVGRTLDVFISKLRKKLEADASVKIVNVRGVGYKLVLDN